MGKFTALFILLLLGNVVFLAWLYWSRRRGSGDGSASAKSDGARRSTASPAGENGRVSRGGDGVLRADKAGEAPVAADNDECAVEDCAVSAAAAQVMPGWTRPEGPFLVPPMVQIGADPARLDCVDILFFPHADAHGFSVRAFSDRQLAVSELKQTAICLEGVPPHRRYACTVSGLLPGEKFTYWVIQGGKVVFEAESAARKGRGQPHRFVVVGDMGNGSVESTRIAYRIFNDYKPDLLSITGDVVYLHGRASEYLRRFLPVYNARTAEPGVGSPLLSQVLAFSSLGNHCVGKMEYHTTPSFNDFPDLHAFFMYWSLPLNGPIVDARSAVNIPELRGNEVRVRRFLNVAQERFPRMGNYSFDYGDIHWLVLDANSYMNWTDEQLRAWVDKDLSDAAAMPWRLVNFHQPGFTSNPKHGVEKRMRLLADLFEKHGVRVVFCGHAHYYERTFPLRFKVTPRADGTLIDEEGLVAGQFMLDKTFDGKTMTRPDGVIYIVSGAGGAKLDPSGIHWRPDQWMPFTDKLIGDRHSFTVCDADDEKLTLRQIDLSGKEVDRLVITR